MRRRIAALAGAAILPGLLLAALSGSARADAATGSYTILNAGNGQCLASPLRPLVVMLPCDGTAHQQWTISPTGTGPFSIRNVATGQYVTVSGGAALTSPSAAYWGISAPGNSGSSISVPGTNLSLTRLLGNGVVVQHATGANSQGWNLVPVMAG
ncbi:MAG TPA: RICIN domain-containing protein [Trebonia sp.]|jgi:hypothetical protein|nr:RICIN domain-containing protein [Trebonia sp.]